MQSEWTDINKITLWDRNPRINEHVVQQIALSIQQFGFVNPIVVQRSTNKIIAGNTRYKAAQYLKLLKVPVVFVDFDDDKAAAYAIADNKLGELALWDDEILSELLQELSDTDINLESLGFNDMEIKALLNNDLGDMDIPEDDVSEISDEATDKITIICPLHLLGELKDKIKADLDGYDVVIK